MIPCTHKEYAMLSALTPKGRKGAGAMDDAERVYLSRVEQRTGLTRAELVHAFRRGEFAPRERLSYKRFEEWAAERRAMWDRQALWNALPAA